MGYGDLIRQLKRREKRVERASWGLHLTSFRETKASRRCSVRKGAHAYMSASEARCVRSLAG